MGKYDDTIGGGKLILDVEEVLNEESAKKVDDRIKKQKADLETPIEINVKSDKAENRLKELAKAAKQVKADLQEAIFSQKSFGEISKIVSKYELLKKQIKAIAPEVSKNNSSLKEGNQILKDTKKLVDQLTVSQEKLNKTKKTKKGDSTKIETKNTKELIEVADDATKTQEKAAKTKLRTQKQINAELDAAEKKLETIQEVTTRISKNSSIAATKGMDAMAQEAVNVTKILSEMYDEGIRDTERYITLQYKLKKIFDAMGKSYGGVKTSGAKNSSELLDLVIDGIVQRTGVNLFSDSKYTRVMENLFGSSDFSLFNKSLSGLGMKHVAELLLSWGKTGDWVDMQAQVTAEVENTVNAMGKEADAIKKVKGEQEELQKAYESTNEIMFKSRDKYLGKDWRHEIYSAKDSKQAAQVLAEIDAQTKLLEEDARQAKLEYNGLMTAISSYIGTSLVNKSDFQKAIKDSWRQGEKEAAAKLFESYQERFPDGKFDPGKQFGDEWTSNFEKNLANANRSLTIWRSQIKSAAEEKMVNTIKLIGELQTKYGAEKFGEIFGDIGAIDVSNAEAVYDLLIAKEEEYGRMLINRANAIAEFTSKNAELIGQFSGTDNWSVVEAKIGEISAGIYETGLSLEEANRQLKEFVETLNRGVEGEEYTNATWRAVKSNNKAIKIRDFEEDAYDLYQEKYRNEHDGENEYLEDTIDIVRKASEYGTKFSADMFTSCSRLSTAVKRFFSAIDPSKYPAIASWKDGILESVNNGYFSEKSVLNNGLYTGEYSWGIDEVADGKSVYVYLNLLDVAKDKEAEFSAYIEAESKKRDEGLEKEAQLYREIGNKYKELAKLRNESPDWNYSKSSDQEESIRKIIGYYEQEKTLIRDILGLQGEFKAIPAKYKSGNYDASGLSDYHKTELVTDNSLKVVDGRLEVYQEALEEFVSNLSEAVDKIEPQIEANKKLESSYEGLVGAVEQYVTSSQKLWEAYDKHLDFNKFAEERNAAIEKIVSMFPDGRIMGGTSAGVYFQDQRTSRLYASKGAEATLADIENQLTRSKEKQVRLAQEAESAALAKITLGSSGKTLAGTKPINFKYAVMSVEDLVMSHDAYGAVNPDYPAELQPRDRNRMASKTQILGMVKNLLPELLVASPTAQNGSPIVSNDGIVVGGNARSAALAEAYATGHADGYKSYITEHASEFGLNPNNMPKNPVLVRVVDIDGGLDTLAKQLNESTTAGYSTTEQALINEELIMKVISKLNIDESANLNSEANKDFVRSFMNLLPDDQKNEMMTKDGSLSAVGLVKVKQALFGAAYGSKEMLENLEQISPEFLNISNALMASAAQAADIRYSVENGVLNDLGVISTILNGVDLLKTARHNNYNIEGYLSQTSLLDSGYAAEDIAIGKFLEANVRNATQLKNMIDIILDFARGAGDPNQISLGGFSEVTLSDVIKGAFTKYAEQYQKKIDYDKLIDGHSPAEVGSRSDKRVDRVGDFEAETQMSPIIEANTQAKQKQVDAASEATKQIEAQADAEKKLSDAVNETADAKERQVEASKKAANASNNVSVEEIITRDVNKALEQLRSAKNNKTSLFTLKGVFEGDDLIDQAQAMVKNIAEQANLSLGKFNVKDDIIKVQLYNEELKVTVDQMYKLRAATEDAESAQLELVSQSFNQNVKALNENNFDVEGIQQRALASIEKVRSSLHGLEYDLTALENVAKDISSQDDFNKFNNQLKAAQDNIQAIKNSTVSKSSMNPLANMQRDMQNANIEIETMRLKLEKFGDIQGVAEAKKMLTDMADAAKQYNNATDAQGQQAAYNQYSNLRSSFKAQTEYINAAKALNDSQKSEEKKTDPIREQYQSILDLVNKINAKSTEITKYQSKDGGSGIFAGYIEQLQSEKARLVSELKGITDEINSTLGSGFVQGKEFSVPFASFLDDSGAISNFLNDTRTQASLATEEIEKLVAALQKSQNIDVQAATKVAEQFKSVQKTYKRLSGLTGLDKGNANYQALVGVFGQIMKYKESLSSDPTSWTPEESSNLQTLIDQFTKYGNALADVGEKEARYFAGKNKYISGDKAGNLDDHFKNQTKAVNEAQKQLEDAARKFAKDSGFRDAIITKFSQMPDGISRIDFSVFDEGAKSLRNFHMEMGIVTDGIYRSETTISKSLANMKAAEKQMEKTSNLLVQLDASEINISEKDAPTSVANLLKARDNLATALHEGDQNAIVRHTQELKNACVETEKLQKQTVQMNAAIANEQAEDIGRGDPKGNVYSQLVEATKEYIGANKNATIEFGRFDAATNTLNTSLTHANGTVETFKVQMSGLNGQMTAQQTGVKQVANSWDQFKASVSSTAKQLAIAVVGYNVFYKAMAEIRKGVGYVKEIDLAMTELKKVTDETEASYKKFLDTAANKAGEIGSTVSDFTEATANFARLNI